MTIRPSPTTVLASALLVAIAALPFHEVFDRNGWPVSVVGAALAASLVAAAVETLRPRLPVPVVVLVTAIAAAAWALMVSLRDTFWRAPGSADTWTDLADGIFNGWGALLDEQSPLTDPHSAETFAAVLVWTAAAAAVHVAARRRTALPAVLASAVVLGVSTAAVLPRGLPSTVIGVGAGAMALFAIATLTRAPDQRLRVGRMVALTAVIALSAALAVVGGAASTTIDRAPVDPRSVRSTETISIEVPDILAEFGVRRKEARTVLTLDSAAPAAGVRLRLQVYEEHNGEHWLPTTGFEEVAAFPPVTDLPPGDLVNLTVTVNDLDGPWIPLPDRVISLDVADIRWNADAQMAIIEEQPAEYDVSGTVLSQRDLQGLASARDEVHERLSEVPPGLPESIRRVADEVTEGSSDAIGAIVAITSRLHTLSRTESSAPGHSFARLRDDLDDGDATGAEQIASLHALMLRSVGIPSRLVVGYVADGPLVESDDLHIWVEAPFPDIGWVAFDPVPPVTETGDDPDEAPVTPSTTIPDSEPLQARALPRELGPGEDPGETRITVDDPFTLTDAVTLVAIVVVGLTALMIGARLIRRRFRRSSGWRAEVRVLGAWAEMVDRLRELGAPITNTTTTGDVVYMAEVMDETLGAHTKAVADLAAIALHAPDGSRPEEATEAWDRLQLAEARLMEVRGRRTVPRRYLDPRVLRYRAPQPPEHRDGGRRSPVRPPSPES